MENINTKTEERRTSPRVNISGSVEIIIDPIKKKKIDGEFVNISNKGMAFITTSKLKQGICYFIKFKLGEGKLIENVKAKLIRQTKVEDKYFTAITFISITEQSRSLITQYIK